MQECRTSFFMFAILKQLLAFLKKDLPSVVLFYNEGLYFWHRMVDHAVSSKLEFVDVYFITIILSWSFSRGGNCCFYKPQNSTLKSLIAICCRHVDSKSRVLFDKSDHPWTSMHVFSYWPSVTEYEAEFSQWWEYDG